MAALGRRFNRRIYDCRWLLVPLLAELDGRRQHFQSQCDSIAVFLLLLPGTWYSYLHESHIDKAIAELG
jgi:hypothetical protein